MQSARLERQEDESLIYLGTGGLAAMLLGVVLVPLRDVTSASNFAFPFMALTMAVAQLGGRRSAVVTALVSVLSWDFFLTRPYLTLRIASKHEIISFVGLAACGLVAAAFGSRSRRKAVDLGATRAHLDLLHETVGLLEEPGAIEEIVSKVLEAARASLPIASLAVRDARGGLIAVAGKEPGQVHAEPALRDERLLIERESRRLLPAQGLPLPEDGARLALISAGEQVGWLELWGNGEKADASARHTLWDVERLLSLLLARGGREGSGHRDAARGSQPFGERR